MRRRLCLSSFLILSLAFACAAFSQGASFEVVSVKPTSPDVNVGRSGWEPNRIFSYGTNLKQLIEWAYQVTDIQVSGGPGWMDSKRFDVEAKAPEGGHNKEELLRMLQPAIADRFKVVLHRETKQLPVYVLTAAGNSSERHESKGGPTSIQIQPLQPPADGKVNLQITGQSVSMPYLTGYMSNTIGRLVVDRSGITAPFDFKVEVTLELTDELRNQLTAIGAALSEAVPKLGFKLDSQRQAVEVLVIDQAEEPSAN